MEVIILFGIVVSVVVIFVRSRDDDVVEPLPPSKPREPIYPQRRASPAARPKAPVVQSAKPPAAAPNVSISQHISGKCYVIDGDTIVIQGAHIRLAGIDAPELEHPWGKKAKWELVRLCKGQIITARIEPEISYDRMVATCFLPDGRDLSAEMVKIGLALDWPKFSGGRYTHLEPEGVRKKHWKAAARQRGHMHVFHK